MIKPIFEFLLWNNCNNNCKFCFQKQQHNDISLYSKKRSIDKVLEFYHCSRFISGSHVLLMGGEIFDCPTIFNDLYRLFDTTIDLMVNNEIDTLYINTNLIYKKLDGLTYLLDLISTNHLFDRFKFTTSYDVDGRFNDKTEALMLSNLQYIKTRYRDIHIVVNSMVSNKMCDLILTDQFDIRDFISKYQLDWVNLIPYIININGISAPRNKIFKTLNYVNNIIPGYLNKYINNLDLKQDKNLFKYNEKTDQLEFCSCDYLPCGHSENFKRYSDCDSCFVCDIKAMFGDNL